MAGDFPEVADMAFCDDHLRRFFYDRSNNKYIKLIPIDRKKGTNDKVENETR